MLHHTTEEIKEKVNSEKDREVLLRICKVVIDLEFKFIKNLTEGKDEYYRAALELSDLPDSIFLYLYHASTPQRFDLIKLAIERIEYLDKLEDAASPRTRSFTNILPLKNS